MIIHIIQGSTTMEFLISLLFLKITVEITFQPKNFFKSYEFRILGSLASP